MEPILYEQARIRLEVTGFCLSVLFMSVMAIMAFGYTP